jgi:hypothetical protein
MITNIAFEMGTCLQRLDGQLQYKSQRVLAIGALERITTHLLRGFSHLQLAIGWKENVRFIHIIRWVNFFQQILSLYYFFKNWENFGNLFNF